MTLDVSVVIPTYNQNPKYLTEAIESALRQSYPRKKYEILVVDDGSTRIPPDQVLSQFKNEDVKLVKKTHGGIAHTLNAGIMKMRGQYFKWLSSDDALCEEGLEILKSKAQEDQIIYGDWVRMDQNSNILDVQHEPIFSNVNEMKKSLWARYFGNASAALIPRSAFVKIGMFDTSLPYYEDYDWWLRAVFIHHYMLVHADGIVAKYRIHPGQGTMRNEKKPLITWLLKKRLYTFPHEPSTFEAVRKPSIALLTRQMFLHDTARLFRTLPGNKPVPSGLKRLKSTLMFM